MDHPIVQVAGIRPVVELNNTGVARMKEGDYEAAITLLSKSLSILKKHFKASCRKDNLEAELSQEFCDHINYRYVDIPFYSTASARTKGIDGTQDRGSEQRGFISRCPIEITSVKACSTANDYLRLPSIIIFNLALSYHCLAIETFDSAIQHASLQKALRLYEIVHGSHSKDDRKQDTLLEIIAIVNNIAEIHKEMHDDYRAHECSNQLLEVFMLLIDGGEVEMVERLEGILSNVMGVVLCQAPVAPAA
jgi:hypothetical protein